MAKSLYSALFDWIVLRINHALLNKKDMEESVSVRVLTPACSTKQSWGRPGPHAPHTLSRWLVMSGAKVVWLGIR